MALDISKAFDRVWHAGLLHKLKSYGISGQIFSLISFFLSNRQLRVVLDGKSSQEYPVNAGVPQGSILGPTHFLLYINDLPDYVICDVAIYADDKTQLVSFDQPNNNGSIDVKMGGSILEEKSSLRCWSRPSLLDWIGVLTLSLLLKVPARKLEL